MRFATLLATSILLVAATAASAAARGLLRTGAPVAPVVSLSILPPQVLIDRPGAAQQLLVLGRRADGSACDLTGQVRFRSTNPGAAPVSAAGVVSALRNGGARVTASLPGASLPGASLRA